MDLKRWVMLLTAAFLITGCGQSDPGKSNPAQSASGPEIAENRTAIGIQSQAAVPESSKEVAKEIVPGSVYKGSIAINLPEATGEVVYEGNGVTIDASNTREGYVMVKCRSSEKRLKARVILGEGIYTYDVNQNEEYEVFPLQMGNGVYQVQVFQQVEGTSYTELYSTQIEVDMPDEDRVFVYPSQYVWYTNEEAAVKLSYDLCSELTSDEEKVKVLYDYVVNLLTYDQEEAETVAKGYIPDLEEVIATKKGICFDYSALLAAMLRAQDIPVRLVMGYVQPDNLYHAWNQAYVNGKWVWMDSTFGPNSPRVESDYAEERKY